MHRNELLKADDDKNESVLQQTFLRFALNRIYCYKTLFLFSRFKWHVPQRKRRLPQQGRRQRRAWLAAERGEARSSLLLHQNAAQKGAHTELAAQVLGEERAL